MNEMKIFENELFGQVRTVKVDQEVWFVAIDIARALGYKNESRSINQHVDDDDKLTYQIGTSGQRRDVLIVNESGMYSLILRSRLDNAKLFKRWVTKEVLPSVRKHGMYITDETLQKSQEELVVTIEQLQEERREMLLEQERIQLELLEKTYFAEKYNVVTGTGTLYTVTDIAGRFDKLSAQKVNKILIEHGIIYKRKTAEEIKQTELNNIAEKLGIEAPKADTVTYQSSNTYLCSKYHNLGVCVNTLRNNKLRQMVKYNQEGFEFVADLLCELGYELLQD